MRTNVRLSCTKITGTGKPRNHDWSNQTQRFKAISHRKGSRKCNQFIISDAFDLGYSFEQVTGIRTMQDGTVEGNCSVKIGGIHKHFRVKKAGEAYSLNADGHTPGRWIVK